MADDAIRCDACPVLCYIKPGRTGSCDRYGNQDGQLVRLDPHVMLERAQSRNARQRCRDIRNRNRRRHNLSRLQARALHYFV